MLALFGDMKGLELFFASCAVFGTVLFVIRLVLMFVGGSPDDSDAAGAGDMDAAGMDAGDFDAGPDMDAGDMHSGDLHDSDLSFKALSLQGITAFFMMFGLVGWAVIRQGDYPAIVPIISGAVAGVLTVWVMKMLFQAAGRLQSSGTMNLANAVGTEGTVYLTIRPGSIGKVQICFQDRYAVLDAVTDDPDEIKTGDAVRVVRVSAGKLVVEKLVPKQND